MCKDQVKKRGSLFSFIFGQNKGTFYSQSLFIVMKQVIKSVNIVTKLSIKTTHTVTKNYSNRKYSD